MSNMIGNKWNMNHTVLLRSSADTSSLIAVWTRSISSRNNFKKTFISFIWTKGILTIPRLHLIVQSQQQQQQNNAWNLFKVNKKDCWLWTSKCRLRTNWNILNCYFAAPRPTYSHCRGGYPTNDVNYCVWILISTRRSPGAS